MLLASKRRFGLVLQGGGALGAYEAGAIKYLYEQGMECAIASGASSGAMNAATLAGAKGYPPAVLEELWKSLIVDLPAPFAPPALRQLWSMFDNPHMYTPRLDYWNLARWTYVSRPTPLKKRLQELLDWDRVRDPGHMRLFVSASDVEGGGTKYFNNLDPSVPFDIENVLASGSFPVGFPWTVVDERSYWDGGLTDNTPLAPILDNLQGDEAETLPIFVIDCNTSTAPLPTNLEQAVLRMFEMFLQSKLKADCDRAASFQCFTRVLREIDRELPPDAPVRNDPDWIDAMKHPNVRDIRSIDMKKPPGDSPADFSRESILRRLDAGYAAMRDALAVPSSRTGESRAVDR